MSQHVLDTLAERGFLEQTTDEAQLRAVLAEPATCYVGFDPTASSLHVPPASRSAKWISNCVVS